VTTLSTPPSAAPAAPPVRKERTPAMKFLLTLLIGFALSIPLFSVWLLVYDRQSQSETAQSSIVEGWGGPQVVAGPVLVIPWERQEIVTVEENGKSVTRSQTVAHELILSPVTADLDTIIKPERRKRSIYEAVVYETRLNGKVKFELPADLARFDVDRAALQYARAELRFGLQDPRGIFGPPPSIKVAGQALPLQPGHGLNATGGKGFFTWLNAASLEKGPIEAEFTADFRGNASLALVPRAGDTRWKVTSTWANPSFQGGFLPTTRTISDKGFTATYRVGNLALGQPLVNADDANANGAAMVSKASDFSASRTYDANSGSPAVARIDLVQPVDLYDQVSRAAKYGFLFIGFTFLTFLMFDLIGGVRVAGVEYVMVGSGLILFFVMLLAFAEVIGFGLAYLVASGAIIGLITAYSAAVLNSRQRASLVGGLLAGLYTVLYVLLSLEAYALLIGSLMLFAALAGVMYVTRKLDWSGAKVSVE
jgi:inner membrane protein